MSGAAGSDSWVLEKLGTERELEQVTAARCEGERNDATAFIRPQVSAECDRPRARPGGRADHRHRVR